MNLGRGWLLQIFGDGAMALRTGSIISERFSNQNLAAKDALHTKMGRMVAASGLDVVFAVRLISSVTRLRPCLTDAALHCLRSLGLGFSGWLEWWVWNKMEVVTAVEETYPSRKGCVILLVKSMVIANRKEILCNEFKHSCFTMSGFRLLSSRRR